jgi:hypothetical protein
VRYVSSDWNSFFQAVVGAAAALTGLLFVAVSINLDKILEGSRFLAARAAETLAVLLLVLAGAALALVPQNSRLLGVELLLLAVPLLAVATTSQIRHRRSGPQDPWLWHVSRRTATAAPTVPAIVAGVSLALGWSGGVYWLVPMVLFGIAGAVYSGWVLLVEILR